MHRLLLSLLLGCFLAIPPNAFGAMTIKLGVVTKPGSAQNVAAQKFKELLEERTSGDVEVKIFHSASLGNETELLQQLQLNTIQMGIITDGPFDTFNPITRVISYPFLFRDNAQADEILDGPLGQEILTALEPQGFKGLCFSENGFRNLTNDRRPVRTPEDVRGLKVRVMASPLQKIIWQALGANPTPMPWPIYTELEQGVIDGQENPLWVMEEYKFYEIQRYMTMTRHVYSAHIDVAALLWWRTLDAGMQSLIRDTMCEAARFQRRDNREKDAARLAFLKTRGMQVEEAPDLEAFRAQLAMLQSNAIYSDPRVQDLLQRMLKATR